MLSHFWKIVSEALWIAFLDDHPEVVELLVDNQ